jgi:hypothetical protein
MLVGIAACCLLKKGMSDCESCYIVSHTITEMLNDTALEVLADVLNTTHVFVEELEGVKTA